MPLPVFHSVASYSVYRLMEKNGKIYPHRKFLVLGLILGLLPDFDFVPGVLLGNATRFHRDFSHSPLMALVVSGVIAILYGVWRFVKSDSCVSNGVTLRADISRIFCFSFLSYATHLLLDYLSAGIPLFWPLTGHRFSCPMAFFQVARGQTAMAEVGGVHAFISKLFSPAYAMPFLFEVLSVVYAAAFLSAMRQMYDPENRDRSLVFIRTVQVLVLTTLGLFVL